MAINGWRIMWLVAVYDCPMTTPAARKSYTGFVRHLLQENFARLQNSVYVRHFPTKAVADACIHRLRPSIPEEASVVFFIITDKQYGMTREYFGVRQIHEKPDVPEQIALF